MDSSQYLQNRFLETMVDKFKQRYLQHKKAFPNFIVAFQGTKAWVIPFEPRDQGHKENMLHVIAAAFAAKGIKRLGYFADVWGADVVLPGEASKLSKEERNALARERRRQIPGDLSEYSAKKECIIWGICGEDGIEQSFLQTHDSETFTLKSKTQSGKEAQVLGLIFARILPLTRQADWDKVDARKSQIWDMMLHYMKMQYTPVQEVELRK